MYGKYIKRFLDIVCALLAITVFSWLYILVAVLVRINLGRPVIFKQERPGKNGRIFCLYKFRTMTDKKDKNGRQQASVERVEKLDTLSLKCKHFREGMQAAARTRFARTLVA